MGIFSFPSSSRKQSSSDSNGNGLVLYQYYHSFYSQKVVFALLEKKLEFRTHLVDLSKCEQYQPWYLKLNPEGVVPTLKDGVKIIPDSSRIIDYLEDNFSNGAPRLLPEKGSEEWLKVKELGEALDGFPSPELTFGAANFPEFCTNSRMTQAERNYRKDFCTVMKVLVQELSIKHPQYREIYDRKCIKNDDLNSKARSVENLQKCLGIVENILDVCETELASHGEDKADWWLCSEMFTLADISLSLVLARIVHLGFYEAYVGVDLRPNLHKYFGRIQERDSFVRLINQQSGKAPERCLQCRRYLSVALGSTAIVGFVAGVIILYRRAK